MIAQSRLEALWKQCGLSTTPLGEWCDAEGFFISNTMPPLTLDSLFKYAVPVVKAQIGATETFVLLTNWCWDLCESNDKANADALFLACEKALEVKK